MNDKMLMHRQPGRRPRRGSLMMEAAFAVAILLVGLSSLAQWNSSIQRFARQMQNRESALLLCSNVIAIVTAIDYTKLDEFIVNDRVLAQSGVDVSRLSGVEVTVDVREIDGGKRLVARVSWANGSDRPMNVALTRWRYPIRETQ
ncbi:MAG TPA: hypothetical protein EYG57_12750 [Planctomycetes bacterium]|nr:hypothetical protein [Planctomycetota bacterium]